MKYIIAKQSNCFLALLEMIINDVIDYPFITQDMLANFFGITILKGHDHEYRDIINISYTLNYKNIGVHINKQKLNDFFINVGIPLRTNYVPATPYGEYSVDQKNIFSPSKEYLIYTFSYGSLYHIPQFNDIGHVALLKEINDNGTITVYDPGPKEVGFKTFNRSDMYDAMWDRRGGIYLFCKL